MKKRAVFAIFAGTAYVLFYWRRLLLDGLVPFDGNMLRLFYPSWTIGAGLLRSGGSLLWDSYRNMGQPFLADPQNQALYPIQFLALALSFVDYERVFIIFHVLLAAIFGYLLGRQWHDDATTALFSGLAFGFNGLFLARVTLPPHFASMAWVPAVLFFFSSRRPWLAGAALALQWMAGFPPFSILTGVILVACAAAARDRRQALVVLLKAGAFAAGLAAVQLIPFLELLKESARPLFLSENSTLEYSLHPIELIRQLTLPALVLAKLDPVTSSDQAIVSFYFGPIIAALAIWGFLKGGRSERLTAAGIFAALLLALGRYNGFYSRIPFIHIFRFPAHWMLPASVALIALAGRGLTAIRPPPLRRILLGAVALDLLLYALPAHTAWGDHDFISQSSIRAPGLESIPAGSRLFHKASVWEGISGWTMTSSNDWLRLKAVLAPSIGTAYGIKEAASFNPLAGKRAQAFLSRLNASPPGSPLFDLAGVSKIISMNCVSGHPCTEAPTVLDNPNYKPTLFLFPYANADSIRATPGSYEVTAEGEGRVILTETYFPGWNARIDGLATRIELVENTFMAAPLPGGRHRVLFRYCPDSFVIGAIISGLTLLVACAALRRRNLALS